MVVRLVRAGPSGLAPARPKNCDHAPVATPRRRSGLRLGARALARQAELISRQPLPNILVSLPWAGAQAPPTSRPSWFSRGNLEGRIISQFEKTQYIALTIG